MIYVGARHWYPYPHGHWHTQSDMHMNSYELGRIQAPMLIGIGVNGYGKTQITSSLLHQQISIPVQSSNTTHITYMFCLH